MNFKPPIDYKKIEEVCGEDKLAVSLFTHILARARHKPGVVKFTNKIVKLERGQFIYGRNKVARYFGCSSMTIDRALKRLEKLFNQVSNQRTHDYTIVTIKNYDEWILLFNQVSNRRATGEQPVCTNKIEEIVENEETEKEREEYSHFLEFWNEKEIIKHSLRGKTGEQIKGAINGRLREGYSTDDILRGIENYAWIVSSDQHYFKYKWTFADFLQRGFEKFKDRGVADRNFRIEKKEDENLVL